MRKQSFISINIVKSMLLLTYLAVFLDYDTLLLNKFVFNNKIHFTKLLL